MSEESLIDPEKLLAQLSDSNDVEPSLIDQIADLLKDDSCEQQTRGLSVDDRYSYLVVLRKANAKRHRSVLEVHLDTHDPLTAALVLETLTLHWGLTDEYLERVLDFALGVSWDEDQDVQQSAIKILGEYLFETLPKECLENPSSSSLESSQLRVLALLLSLFQDTEGEHWVRQTAYFSIARAAKFSWEELPAECAQLDFSKGSKDLNQDLINKCLQLVPQSSSDESKESLGSAWPSA
jgi:hypothetical protein